MTVSLFNQFKRSLDTDVGTVRREFLDLIDDALSFSVDHDASYDDGRWRDLSTVSLTISRSAFNAFADVLGITDKDGMRRPTE